MDTQLSSGPRHPDAPPRTPSKKELQEVADTLKEEDYLSQEEESINPALFY